MSERNRWRWKLILTLIAFMREATDAQLVQVTHYAATIMAGEQP